MFGASRISAQDDVRRMRSLSPELVSGQARMQSLTGFDLRTQCFVLRASDKETAPRREETLLDRRRPLRLAGAPRFYRAPASFLPSAARQRENRQLRETRLEAPLLAGYLARIRLEEVVPDPPQA